MNSVGTTGEAAGATTAAAEEVALEEVTEEVLVEEVAAFEEEEEDEEAVGAAGGTTPAADLRGEESSKRCVGARSAALRLRSALLLSRGGAPGALLAHG